jgi:hypothetical protein
MMTFMTRCFNLNFFLCFIILSLVFSACEEPSEFEIDDPAVSGIDINDVEITASTVWGDSTNTTDLSRNLLGAYNDPLFGYTEANLATDFRLDPDSDYGFSGQEQIDSVVLYMQIDFPPSIYGSDQIPVRVDVHQLNEILLSDSGYFANTPINYDQQTLGYWEGVTEESDSTIRFNLDPAFGEYFTQADTNHYNNNTSLKAFFNGFFLKSSVSSFEPGRGKIFRVDPIHQNSRLVVYYNGGSNFSFQISGNSVRVNNYKRDHSGTEVGMQLNNPAEYETVYAQAMGGPRVRLHFPGLRELAMEGNYVVHRARVHIPVLEGSTSGGLLPPPTRLLLLGSDEDGRNTNIPDMFDHVPNYGGGYQAGSNSYTFTITNYIQEQLKKYGKDPDNHIEHGLNLVVPTDNPLSARRLAIPVEHSDKQNVWLELKLSKVD